MLYSKLEHLTSVLDAELKEYDRAEPGQPKRSYDNFVTAIEKVVERQRHKSIRADLAANLNGPQAALPATAASEATKKAAAEAAADKAAR